MADATENTPLLRSLDPDPIGEHEPYDGSTPNAPDPSLRFVTASTWLSLVLSVLVVAFDLTVGILDRSHYGGSYYMPWEVETAIQAMCIVGLSTALISFLNLVRLYINHRALWLWLNLIFDFVIAFSSIASSGQGLLQNWLYVCSPAEQDCQFARRVQIFENLTLGLSLALGITHLVLFLLRCALAFRMRFWRGFQHWKLPAGQLTIEFTIKFLRQEHREQSRQ